MRRQVLLPVVYTNNENIIYALGEITDPDIEPGELVINALNGYESLYIKNSRGEFVPFDSRSVITSQIRSEMANTVASVSVNNETGEMTVVSNNGSETTNKIGYFINIKQSSADCTAIGDAYIDDNGVIKFYTNEGFIDGPILRGQDGHQGPAGENGIGMQGPSGINGVGEQGPEGIQGPKGDDGAVGLQGPIGIQGPVGGSSEAGTQGPEGVQGPVGEAGVGEQGPEGVQGPIGVGNQGPDGIQGPIGEFDEQSFNSFSANIVTYVDNLVGSATTILMGSALTVSGQTVALDSNTIYQALVSIMTKIVENEEVVATALVDLNTRLQALEGGGE